MEPAWRRIQAGPGTPELAARRECIEELGIELDSFALVLEEHLTSIGGKQGHLKIICLLAISDEVSPNGEISEARWAAVDLTDLPGNPAVSKWVHSALKAHAKAQLDLVRKPIPDDAVGLHGATASGS